MVKLVHLGLEDEPHTKIINEMDVVVKDINETGVVCDVYFDGYSFGARPSHTTTLTWAAIPFAQQTYFEANQPIVWQVAVNEDGVRANQFLFYQSV